MNWEKLFKRYIWDDDRTPYFVAPHAMTKRQADYEIFAYAVFIGSLIVVVTIAAMSRGENSDAITLFGFSAIVSTVILSITKHPYAAYYCGVIPVVLLLYLMIYGFPASLAPIDHFVVIVFALLWLLYSYRVVRIAKAYPDLSGHDLEE